MESQGTDRSPSLSGSEEMESNADSDHEDEGENEKDSDNENQGEDDDDDDDDDDDEDDEDDDKEDSDGEESEMEMGENDHGEDSESQGCKNGGLSLKHLASRGHVQDGESYSADSESQGCKNMDSSLKENSKNREEGHTQDGESYSADSEGYPLADLPLEVITIVEPTNYAYPVLKNMSNGVLTHRNIFTEHERSVLKEIINKYRNIVDTRSRTREIYLEKQSVWQQIVEEYNSTENIMVRTEKELRKCWDNMKYRAKQAEKEMIKVEQNFAGMEHDLHTLAQQAIEEAAMQAKVLQRGATMKPESAAPEFEVKQEPPDNDEVQSASADEDEFEERPGNQTGVTLAEEEREPALKKARQESPKLSSLLLAAANKRSSSKKSSGHKSSSGGGFPYNIPACTKVMHIKKKNHSNASSSINTSSNSEIPILPKSLASCLSITNIPNPINSNSHTSISFGTHGKEMGSRGSSPVQHSMKPMPSLKKMVPGKHQSSGSSKNIKKSNISSKARGHSSNSLPNVSSGHNLNSNHNSVLQGNSGLGSPTNSINEKYKSEMNDRLLNAKLATQRLELERREHEVRMKLLEKELQAQTYQSQYWFLKLKLLKSGRENMTFNMAGATNGDID